MATVLDTATSWLWFIKRQHLSMLRHASHKKSSNMALAWL